uniref:Bzip transcription factor C/EBP n=1 Tax=Podocoryna carnea TaxID=6096 RepID=Q6JQ20_PODCA|nr:bzip transcription factor C/EBP [Podocoryna carnea]
MIPPTYFAAQLQAAQRRVREGIQAVPSMESDSTVNQQPDSLFPDCVLDLSRYLTSSDLPGTTPREFFDDLFHEKIANGDALHKPLPGVVKIKEEPDSTATSRCSTPESLLPEHDFDNGDFPTPKFQGLESSRQEKGEGLMCQLQSINSSNNSSDVDSDSEKSVQDLDRNARKLKAALAHHEQSSQGNEISPGRSGNVSPTHLNTLKSPRHHKSRKNIEKGSEEYIVKRERNNVAVRKSRTKAKLKHIETQMRVGELTEENDQLRNRISTLQKELNALKSFITFNCPSSIKPPGFTTYPPMFSSTKIM